MSKLLIFFSLMIIVCHLADGMSCGSCGSECVNACGTRRFRTCCFNYLRKKRVPDTFEVKMPDALDFQEDPDLHFSPHALPEDLELWWRDATKARQQPRLKYIDSDK